MGLLEMSESNGTTSTEVHLGITPEIIFHQFCKILVHKTVRFFISPVGFNYPDLVKTKNTQIALCNTAK